MKVNIGDMVVYYGRWLWRVLYVDGDYINIQSIPNGTYEGTRLSYGGITKIISKEATDAER